MFQSFDLTSVRCFKNDFLFLPDALFSSLFTSVRCLVEAEEFVPKQVLKNDPVGAGELKAAR